MKSRTHVLQSYRLEQFPSKPAKIPATHKWVLQKLQCSTRNRDWTLTLKLFLESPTFEKLAPKIWDNYVLLVNIKEHYKVKATFLENIHVCRTFLLVNPLIIYSFLKRASVRGLLLPPLYVPSVFPVAGSLRWMLWIWPVASVTNNIWKQTHRTYIFYLNLNITRLFLGLF